MRKPLVRDDMALGPGPNDPGSVTASRAIGDRYWRTLGLIGFVVVAALASFPAVVTIQQIRAGSVCDQRGGESYTEDAGMVGLAPAVSCVTTWTDGEQLVDRQQVWVAFIPLMAVLGSGWALERRRRRR